MWHHVISNCCCKVPTSYTCTSIMKLSLSSYLFYSFVMYDMKGMVAFGFNLTHVSLKSSPIASSVKQHVCKNCMEYNSPRPPVTYTCSTFYWGALDWECGKHLTIRKKTQIQKYFWVHHQISLSLHHHHSLLAVQKEGLFTHQSGKYQCWLM